MASKSDGNTKRFPRYSRMQQPPLIKQLRSILSEYPDGGQIIKELIQNAEDAEASRMEIVYDRRRINRDKSNVTSQYTKFFQSPALIVYNNAEFKDEDWDGIQKIYSSVKEGSFLKIGRLGQGFKSVFHMTDCPCVISGKQLLLIDPQQSTDKVNAMIYLDDLKDIEDLDINDIRRALVGTFGINSIPFETGDFNGSLFWLPLRENASKISDTLYDNDKVMNLFEGFRMECSSLLLFMKHIERISIKIRSSDNICNDFTAVEISDSNGSLRIERQRFKEKLDLRFYNNIKDDIEGIFLTCIKTLFDGKIVKEQNWIVAHYFEGNSASKECKQLLQDDMLGFSPLVGVAAPVQNNDEETFEGHIFCFLPLPREGKRLTDLPVHVNGFFALNQSRHHLKWYTDEQRGQKIDDKAILWNQLLIKQILPKAYRLLVRHLVSRSTSSGNAAEHINDVYRALPQALQINDKWKQLEENLYNIMKDEAYFFCNNEKQWINPSIAWFAKEYTDLSHVKSAVAHCCFLMGKKYVDITGSIFETLKLYYERLNDITPKLLSQLLLRDKHYKEMTQDEKLKLLEYLCSYHKNYDTVKGLQMLPLESGNFEVFQEGPKSVYKCSTEEKKMFPGLEEHFLLDEKWYNMVLQEHFQNMLDKELFQLKTMDISAMQTLLKKTLLTVSKENMLMKGKLVWLQDVWKLLLERDLLHHFTDFSIMPIVTRGQWPTPSEIRLNKLSDLLIMKVDDDNCLPDDFCEGLTYFNIKVIPALPTWIPKRSIDEYIFMPCHSSVLSILGRVASQQNLKHMLDKFNKKFSNKESFVRYFAYCRHIEKNTSDMLKLLEIYHIIYSRLDLGQYCSLSDAIRYVPQDHLDYFPEDTKFPFPLLTAKHDEECFLVELGARKISIEELLLESMRSISTSRNNKEATKFMQHFVLTFHRFEKSSELVKAASEMQFLKTGNNFCKASDVFDPSDPLLQDLLFDENLLPITAKSLPTDVIRVLQCLGMKSINHLTAMHLLQVAQRLHSWSEKGRRDDTVIKKAKALLTVLNAQPNILNGMCQDGKTLKQCIDGLSCITIKTSNNGTSYPGCLPWYSHSKVFCKPSEATSQQFCKLVGGMVPIVENTSPQLSEAFGWHKEPAIHKIMHQLRIVCNCFSESNMPDIMPVLKSIYMSLANRISELHVWLQETKDAANLEIIWNGVGFVTADKIILQHCANDVRLEPYYFWLPKEFSNMFALFSVLGCHETLDVPLLIATLQTIKLNHDQLEHDLEIVNRDRAIVLCVLERLAKEMWKPNVEVNVENVLMLVREVRPDSITLLPVSDCVVNDDPDVCYEDTSDTAQHLVDSRVSPDTAKTLGVQSVAKQSLCDAEHIGYEEWCQEEPLTARIHGLLRDGYTDGLAVAKELLQNADDAEATCVKFIYDERQNNEFQRKLLTKEMKKCQGPALWVYNDGKFSEKDFENVIQLNGSTKDKDIRKIGKFGLGLCSVYNLTDVPSFISGSNMVIFDPHGQYLKDIGHFKNSRGIKINLNKRNLVNGHSDQFKPYEGIFGCSILGSNNVEYNNTLFRLPLRTEAQSRTSKISTNVYSKYEMIELLHMLIGAAGNLLLFLQHVKKMEIYHIEDRNETLNHELCFCIDKETMIWQQNKFFQKSSILTRIPAILKNPQPFVEVHKVTFVQTLRKKAKDLIVQLKTHADTATSTWLLSWATGVNTSLQLSRTLKQKRAVPLAAVAIPCTNTWIPTSLNSLPGFYKEGHVFCFLPLPITSQLNFHVNGCFDVAVDRRQLFSITEDDKQRASFSWNAALQQDALLRSYIHLLEILSQHNDIVDKQYSYHSLWPTTCSEILSPFRNIFFKMLIEQKLQLFKGEHAWVSFDEVLFLDPLVRNDKLIGCIAFEMLSKFPIQFYRHVIAMPDHVLLAITECNLNSMTKIKQAHVSEEQIVLHFLNMIDNKYWEDKETQKQALLLRALSLDNIEIKSKLRNVQCLRTQPNGKLRTPGELIDPDSELADLFSVHDERFLLKLDSFPDRAVISKLLELGMNDKMLPRHLLIDRFHSVGAIAQTCIKCAKLRIVSLLKYISKKYVLTEILKNTSLVSELRQIDMIPVLNRPEWCTFIWNADSNDSLKRYESNYCKSHEALQDCGLVLGKPTQLFRQSLANVIGSSKCITNEKDLEDEMFVISHEIIKILGIQDNNDVQLKDVVCQIRLTSDEYANSTQNRMGFKSAFSDIYDFLQFALLKSEDLQTIAIKEFHTLSNKPVVLIGDELVKACNVVFNVAYECPPKLNKVPKTESRRNEVFKLLGVKEYFSIDDVISALDWKNQEWSGRKCEEVEQIINILRNLQEVMKREDILYKDLDKYKDRIIAPDIDCYLLPTYELVMDDAMYKSNCKMKLLHGSISHDLANTLGIKSKTRKTVEIFSKAYPFGQREKIVTRLQALLQDLSYRSSIINELVQNADDANASEIHFIKDYRMHKTKYTFGSEQLQGPSLCVFNNSYFTEHDFKGIHYIGEGSKREDPTKTGQYGVGFAAVYHLTDAPSFYTMGPNCGTAGTLCIFDPLQRYIKEHITEEEPGLKCDVEEMKQYFPDVMDGYLQDNNSLFSSGVGTLFRLPLRTEKSEFGDIFSIENMNDLLNSFKANMDETLLFVKNIKCVRVSNIVDGDLKEEYCIQTEISQEDECQRKAFFDAVNVSTISKTFSEPLEVNYTMTVSDILGKSSLWHIVQRFGCKGFKEDNSVLTQLPIGGVAVPLLTVDNNLNASQENCDVDNVSDTFHGKAFCYLPLPEETGLPIHFHGHFNLDRARGSFLNEGPRHEWNKLLLREIVSVAWISAITFLQSWCFPKRSINTDSRCISLNSLVEKYYKYFPVYKGEATNKTVKELIDTFYKYSVENACAIFAVITKTNETVHDTTVQQHCKYCVHKCNISWVPFSKSEDSLAGVFDDIKSNLNNDNMPKRKHIESILRTLGLRIINAKYPIQNTMKKVGIELYTTSPHTVIIFLKSFLTIDENRCLLGSTPVPVHQTMIRSASNVCSLIKYIKLHKHILDILEGLPLCLTNDNILRVFDSNHPVFVSKFATLLPNSSKCFLHIELVEEFGDIEHRALIRFQIKDLLNYLPYSIDARFTRNNNIKWDKEKEVTVSPSFVKQFYHFLYLESLQSTPDYKSVFNAKLFTENVQMFHNWSFMPSIESNGSATFNVLVPIGNASHVILKTMKHPDGELKAVLAKINLPTLDESIFDEDSELKLAVSNLVSSSSKPSTFLQCLLINKERIAMRNLNVTEGIALLSYFNRNITKLRKTTLRDTREHLKALPFFPTHLESLVSIETACEVCVLPEGMPRDGMDAWSRSMNIVLLKSTSVLAQLYKYLKLQELDILSVYVDKLLPTMQHLPQKAWRPHVSYVRDALFDKNLFKSSDISQEKLVNAMSDLKFIQVNGEFKQVSSFYCHNNELLMLMLDEDNFLPNEYRSAVWRPFMKALGLQDSVSDQMILDFAKRIEDDGQSISEQTKKKSDSLLSHIFSHEWETETLDQVKRLKFVVPFVVSEEQRAIYKQPNSGLICLFDALPYKFADICWTSVNLLEKLPKDQELSKHLGILEKPSLEQVILHCENICVHFEQLLARNNSSFKFISDTMEKLYDFLSKCIHDNRSILQRLKQLSFVYIPDDRMLVKAQNVIINLTQEQEIKPYIFKAPNYYGKYCNLFEVVGCSRSVTAANYAAVLEHLKNEYVNDPLPRTAIETVSKTLDNMTHLLLNNRDRSLDKAELALYLPNKDNVLRISNSLVLSNNKDFEKRLEKKCPIDYFMGFKELGIFRITDPTSLMKKFPRNMRTSILTEVVEEIISADNVIEKESNLAAQIECFIHNPCFHEGVLRLIKHELTKQNRTLTSDQENAVTMKLSHVEVKKVTGLKTYLSYKKQQIEGSERLKTCVIKQKSMMEDNNITAVTLFFQSESLKMDQLDSIIAEDDGLIPLIDKCTDSVLGSTIYKLYQIFHYIDKPESIQEKLDTMKIDPYDMPQKFKKSVFPKPGKYVDQKLYPFLEQSIVPFKPHEFVALELEDAIDNCNLPNDNEYESVYIYAYIIKEIKSSDDLNIKCQYAINIGDRGEDEPLCVPIYRLYRFVEKTPDLRELLAKHKDEASEDLSLEKNCQRLQEILTEAWKLGLHEFMRIIRRMLLKWHLDRDSVSKEYATSTFKYIKTLIKHLELEEGKELKNNINEETGNYSPDLYTTSFPEMFTRVDARAKKIARSFNDSIEDYNSSNLTGSSVSFNSEHVFKKKIAKRWLDQANIDHKTAEAAFPNAEKTSSYNWICYICHQSCEKALKAALFVKDVNGVSSTAVMGHCLSTIAQCLDVSDISNEVRNMEQVLNKSYSSMRYPDTFLRLQKPSDIYTVQHASATLKIASKLLAIISTFIDETMAFH